MKSDIEKPEDIKLLVDKFYEKVTADEILGHIFTDVAQVNWENHLPIMYAFWESNLLGTTLYRGSFMDTHFKLNHKIALSADAFDRWKALFKETVDGYFTGQTANTAKQRAVSIADLMFYKINNH